MSALDHINAEVDSLFQKYDNVILKFISPTTLRCEIYAAVGYIGTTFQVMVAGEPDLETWLILWSIPNEGISTQTPTILVRETILTFHTIINPIPPVFFLIPYHLLHRASQEKGVLAPEVQARDADGIFLLLTKPDKTRILRTKICIPMKFSNKWHLMLTL